MKRPSPFSVAAVLLLALMAVLAGGAALRESVTVDEVSHVAAGVSYWQKLDLRSNPEHPPLAKLIAALPLVLRGTHADYTGMQWTIGSTNPFYAFLGEWVFGDWLLFRWNDPVRTLAWARMPMLGLTLILGWVIYLFGRRFGGNWGGLLCVAVYAATPTFIAFGPLVHTDIAIALFSLLTAWTFADLYAEPTPRRKWIFALCLAGALLSKFTAGLLLIFFAVFILITRWFPLPGQPADKAEARAWRKPRRKAVVRGVWWAAVMVYGVYAIFTWNQPTWVLNHIPGGAFMVPIRRLLMPAFEYLMGIAWVLVTGSRPTFLLGKWYPHGEWFYFPIVLVLKSPLGFLALLGLGGAMWITARRKWGKAAGVIGATEAIHWRSICVAFYVMTAACLASRMTFSIRHFSVPLVFLILFLAPLPVALEKLRLSAPRTARLLQGAVAVSALSCIVAAVAAYPFYFPFMNVLTAGHPPHTLVSDSNVDWNQSLPEVVKFAEKRGLKNIVVDSYSLNSPADSIPNARPWNCQTPQPSDAGQLVFISANLILDSHNCPWLMALPKEEIAGGAMYAVQLPSVIPPAGTPGGPPLPSQFRQLGGIPGQQDLRAAFSEVCAQPEKIPALLDQWQKEYQKQQAQSRAQK